MTLHLSERFLGENVELSQIGRVKARNGDLLSNLQLRGVLFLFVLQGEVCLRFADGSSTTCRDGEMLVVFPDCGDSLASGPQGCDFTFFDLGGREPVRAVLRLGYWNRLRAKFERSLTEFAENLIFSFEKAPAHGRDTQVLAKFEHILLLQWRYMRMRTDTPDFFDIIRRINGLPLDYLTTEGVAEDLCISRSKLNRVFMSALNLRPGAYLAQVKTAAVCELLTRSDLTVAKIAERTGFSSASALAIFLRKQCGRTPKDYRKRIGKNDSVLEDTNSFLLERSRAYNSRENTV